MPIFKRKALDVTQPAHRQEKVVPVLPAKTLLGNSEHQALIGEIRSLIDLPEDQFELLCQGFLDRFAEFVQLLPTKPNARLGTLLNQALLRGVNCLHYLLDNHGEVDVLECYALFTAAVLYDVAYVLTHQRVFITEEGGKHIADWVFSRGSLHKQSAQWYKIFPYKRDFSRLRDPVVVLLAQQILPPEGYDWITSHWRVFIEWLDALCQTGLKGMRFNFILDIIRFEKEELFIDELPEIHVDYKEPTDTVVADEFFLWLERELDDEKIKLGDVDPDLYVLADGVFLDSRVVDRFSKYYNCPSTVVWFQIGNCLGIAKQSGQDFRFDQFFGARGKGLLSTGHAQVKGLYLSNDFVKTSGAVNSHVTLQGSAPARDYQVTLQQSIKPTSKK